MARPLRVEYPGAFYHVMNLGNQSEDIFHSPYDREKFFDYLATSIEKFSIKVHTYCLMTNHYHLLVETAEPNLSSAIKWLNGSYAAFIGKAHPPEWLETNWLLSCFGKSQKESMKNYRQFAEGVDAMSVKNPYEDVTGVLILGSPDFVTWVKKTFLTGKKESNEVPQLRKFRPKLAPEAIVGEVCREFGAEKNTIIGKGAKLNVVRDLAIYLSKRYSGDTCKALGEYYGQVPPGNRLERLKGDRKNQYSIRINQQYRICFIWEEGHAYEVEITDYH